MYFLIIIITFFALLGLLTLIQNIFIRFFKINNSFNENILLIKFSKAEGVDIAIETQIALSRFQWYNKNHYDKVYAVNCGLSKAEADTCIELCQRHGIELINNDEIEKLL